MAAHRLTRRQNTLFVYGSLTFPEVLRAVLGRVPEHRPASAAGWRAAALRDRPFPGLVRGDGVVTGLVLSAMTEREWRTADDFEGPFYDLVTLALVPGGFASAYVCATDGPVLPADWDRDRFAAEEMDAYLQRCAAFRAGALM
ncbi:gamma-glutamylcyclotransferase family protein [Streptomyces sp. DT24]|uniref:gamma-glutamylcyclotransferase family protein n=1 Tax=unclassified Streptomyces TaxID=2593676 RepID=UPI0023B8FF53|nr:gamma-glutamylcyclotransferase family protein [Streptomyces sp. AM 4-1-1]WEH33232.1 gamma-glutamylcyclotransferase [Streptomyces sp. AM 4-1-1]